jgi:hypothetical protein
MHLGFNPKRSNPKKKKKKKEKKRKKKPKKKKHFSYLSYLSKKHWINVLTHPYSGHPYSVRWANRNTSLAR